MYVHPMFKCDDATAWAFVRSRSFGTLTAVHDGTPVAAHLPFAISRNGDGTPVLQMHVARPNPIHEIIAREPKTLMIVSGPDAYISPDWYVSADQVPTWNYIAVHLTGTARVLPPEATHDHVENLSLAFEERLKPKKPWSTSKMPEKKLAAMLKAIVPIELRVEKIEASFKASQNKSEADRQEVARMLGWRGGWGEKAMSEAMRQLMLPGAGE